MRSFMTCSRYQVLLGCRNKRRMKWAGYVVRMEEGRSAYGVLVGKREGKRPLGRPGHIWEPVDL